MVAHFDVDVYYALSRIERILASNVLVVNHVLTESAFIEVIVRLSELLQKANSQGHRVTFTDDVCIYPNINDITDAVRECRDAVCHVRANGHFITPEGRPKPRGRSTDGCSKLTFNVASGRVILIQTPRYTIQSEYDDDVCFFYGAHRIYLKRHIIRATKEVKAILMPHDPFARPPLPREQ